MKKLPELALPAGSLQCALYAFKGGADAVYLGMKAFSARKGAVNFSFEDLRKLKHHCMELDKKFYVTLNTLVTDSQMPDVIKLLQQLDYLKPDGVIVQDLGIADIVRRYFPSIPLHASTQLAVHNAEGVRVLRDLGFSRIVLSRELSFDEIKEIRENCPDVEMKVFIHGAMCYGFSGLCMASEKITGRSANCGECAQICRTWFTDPESKKDFWCFSMKDLCLGEKVKQYADIGIDSLKIEGRMKGPEYVYNTARYYRAILDGYQKKETENIKDSMLTTFSRQTTEGFFSNGHNGSCNGDNLICSDYPSHIGLEVGKIKKIFNGKALIQFDKPVAVRDGLLVINGKEHMGFALSETDNGKSFVNAGELCTVNFPSEKFSKLPQTGTPVYCTSRHDGTLPALNENLPLYKQPVDISVNIFDKSIEVNGFNFDADIQESRKPSDTEKIFTDIFSSSDKSYFSLGKMTINNKSSYVCPFIPLSQLKTIRRSFYERADEKFINTGINIEKPELEIKTIKPDKNATVFHPLMFTFEYKTEGQIVLNNVGQIQYAKTHNENTYLAGTFLYAKNSWAYNLLRSLILNFEGLALCNDKDIPLFISRVCYRHNALNLQCKGCTKNNTYQINQNGKTYKIICRNCITEVYDV